MTELNIYRYIFLDVKISLTVHFLTTVLGQFEEPSIIFQFRRHRYEKGEARKSTEPQLRLEQGNCGRSRGESRHVIENGLYDLSFHQFRSLCVHFGKTSIHYCILSYIWTTSSHFEELLVELGYNHTDSVRVACNTDSL